MNPFRVSVFAGTMPQFQPRGESEAARVHHTSRRRGGRLAGRCARTAAERVRRIGVLMYLAADDTEGQARLAAFTQALKQLGWSDGRNLRVDTRWATADDIRRHAAELAAMAPDVLVAGKAP